MMSFTRFICQLSRVKMERGAGIRITIQGGSNQGRGQTSTRQSQRVSDMRQKKEKKMSNYVVRKKGKTVEDDGWSVTIPKFNPNQAWGEVPLPQCPDCGGDMVWYEAGYVPGTRKCMGKPVSEGTYREENSCGSFFRVTGEAAGNILVERERFY